MALPGDFDNTSRNARKHFIQPALPALSLISKTGNLDKTADRQELDTSNNDGVQSVINISDLSKDEINHMVNETSTIAQESFSTDSESQSLQDSTASELPLSSATDSDRNITEAVIKEQDAPLTELEVNGTVSEGDITGNDIQAANGNDDHASSLEGSDSAVLSEPHSDSEPHENENDNQTELVTSSSPSQSSSTSPVKSTQENSSEAEGDTATMASQSDTDEMPHYLQVNTDDPFAVNLPLSDGFQNLDQYLVKIFETKECADWMINVAPHGVSPFAIYAHRTLLERSDLMKELMNQPPNSPMVGGVTTIRTPRPVLPIGFETALRFLYTNSVLGPSAIKAGNSASRLNPRREYLVEFYLSYWISGIELGIEAVTIQAESLFRDMIKWDIVEMVASEAGLLTKIVRTAPIDSGLLPGYTNMSTSVLKAVVKFLAKEIKTDDFQLDVMGGPRFMAQRLGPMNYGRPVANPALANLTFGSMPAILSTLVPVPPTTLVFTSPENSIASNILLNMDFYGLRLLAKEYIAVQGAEAAKVMQIVINERENQRLNVIANRYTMGGPRQIDPEIWDLVGLKEILEGDTLRRERVGRHY